jgi:uncharacterized protein (TIGR02271 family)
MHRTIDRSQIQTGWKVYSSDGTDLGTVDEVGENYVLVEKGFFLPRELYIPLTAIDRTEDNSLWLSVQKDDIDSQGWTAAPELGRDTARIPVHEEELQVHKSARKAGEVEVTKDVVEEQRAMNVPVTREEVQVRRTPVDRPATDAEMSFREGQETIRVPVLEEDVEVTKRPRVKEEIEIDKIARQDTERVGDTVRREEVTVTKEPGDPR